MSYVCSKERVGEIAWGWEREAEVVFVYTGTGVAGAAAAGPELSGWEARDVMVEAGAGARCQEDVIKCVRSENRVLVEGGVDTVDISADP